MGNFDRWSTPKQIKINRKGEPRPLRRGILKGERRKGKKARLDEILSSKKTLETYAGRILRQQEREREPFYSRHGSCFDRWWDEGFADQLKKHTKLLKAALKDRVIDSAFDWWVFKP